MASMTPGADADESDDDDDDNNLSNEGGEEEHRRSMSPSSGKDGRWGCRRRSWEKDVHPLPLAEEDSVLVV
jgi:hypothetical protein